VPVDKAKQWMLKSAHLVRKEAPMKKRKEEEADKTGYCEAEPS